DSNPRGSYPHSGFRDRPVQPLPHLSEGGRRIIIVHERKRFANHGAACAVCYSVSDCIQRETQMKKRKAAAKLIVLDNDDPISAHTQEIHDRIRERAYQLSQQRGHSGRDVDDWLSAESEIISVPPAELIEKADTFQVRMAIVGIDLED